MGTTKKIVILSTLLMLTGCLTHPVASGLAGQFTRLMWQELGFLGRYSQGVEGAQANQATARASQIDSQYIQLWLQASPREQYLMHQPQVLWQAEKRELLYRHHPVSASQRQQLQQAWQWAVAEDKTPEPTN